VKTPYRFVAPPLQNETASLGFILGCEGFERTALMTLSRFP